MHSIIRMRLIVGTARLSPYLHQIIFLVCWLKLATTFTIISIISSNIIREYNAHLRLNSSRHSHAFRTRTRNFAYTLAQALDRELSGGFSHHLRHVPQESTQQSSWYRFHKENYNVIGTSCIVALIIYDTSLTI